MEDVYSHLTKLNSLISSIKSSKVHALEAFASTSEIPLSSTGAVNAAPKEVHRPPIRGLEHNATPQLRIPAEESHSTEAQKQSKAKSPRKSKRLREHPKDDKSQLMSKPKSKSKSKFQSQPRPKPSTDRKVVTRLDQTSLPTSEPKGATKPVSQRKQPLRSRGGLKKKRATDCKDEKTAKVKQEPVQAKVEEALKTPRIKASTAPVGGLFENEVSPPASAYMLVPSRCRYIVTNGSRFLRCTEDYAAELATPHREVYICDHLYTVCGQQPSTIELDQPVAFNVQASYDGKATVYFKASVEDLSTECIQYCRMHGSGKVYQRGGVEVDQKEEKRRRRQDRKLMLQEELRTRESRNLREKSELRRKQLAEAQKTTRQRLKQKIQQQRFEELQKQQQLEKLKRNRQQEKIQSAAMAKELKKRSQMRVKEYLKRTAASTSANDTKHNQDVECTNTMKGDRTGISYRTVVIKRLRKAKAEQLRKMLELGVPVEDEERLRKTSTETKPISWTRKGGERTPMALDDQLQHNCTRGRKGSMRESKPSPEPHVERNHGSRAPRVVLQRATEHDVEAHVGFRIVDL